MTREMFTLLAIAKYSHYAHIWLVVLQQINKLFDIAGNVE